MTLICFLLHETFSFDYSRKIVIGVKMAEGPNSVKQKAVVPEPGHYCFIFPARLTRLSESSRIYHVIH